MCTGGGAGRPAGAGAAARVLRRTAFLPQLDGSYIISASPHQRIFMSMGSSSSTRSITSLSAACRAAIMRQGRQCGGVGSGRRGRSGAAPASGQGG